MCLAQNPEKQEKLRQEVLKVLPEKDSEFEESTFKNMPYLRACIKESLRMYPLVVGNARVPIKDVVVSGYRVPKDVPVVMCSTSLMRDPKHFPRPNEYLPERWLRTTEDTKSLGECPNALKPILVFAFWFWCTQLYRSPYS